MLVVSFTDEELFAYLRLQGCDELNLSLDHRIAIYWKNEDIDSITPIKIQGKYYPFQVNKICEALEIPLPEKFRKFFEQLAKLKKSK